MFDRFLNTSLLTQTSFPILVKVIPISAGTIIGTNCIGAKVVAVITSLETFINIFKSDRKYLIEQQKHIYVRDFILN